MTQVDPIIPPGNQPQMPNDFLQRYMNSNLRDGVREDYSDLLPPAVRERPQQREPNRPMMNLSHLGVGGAKRLQPLSPQQNLKEQFQQAMQKKDHMCVICGEEPERLMATCCGAMMC